jgi:hypothetical protein
MESVSGDLTHSGCDVPGSMSGSCPQQRQIISAASARWMWDIAPVRLRAVSGRGREGYE